MIKSNTWHQGALDLKMCWRFFKYKLVLDDIKNKLRRDTVFIEAIISSMRSKDSSEPPLPEAPENPTPGTAKSKGKNVRFYTDGSPLEGVDEIGTPGPSGSDRPVQSHNQPSHQWIIPCYLGPVLNRIRVVSKEVDTLLGPLAEINHMVPSTLWL
jgi:hypothetical protein